MGWVKKSASVVKGAPRLTMAASHVFTRYTHPRYEVWGAAGGTVPCANVPHVVEIEEGREVCDDGPARVRSGCSGLIERVCFDI